MDTFSEEVYTIFSTEFDKFVKDRENYDIKIFFQDVFFPNIRDIAFDLPNYFHRLINTKNIDAISLIDFCNSFINDIYINFLLKYHEQLENIQDSKLKEEEIEQFDVYCSYGLLLYNSIFLFNKTIFDNIDKLGPYPSINVEDQKTDNLIKSAISEACLERQNETLEYLNSVCKFLKKININTVTHYSNLLSDKLNLDTNFEITLN